MAYRFYILFYKTNVAVWWVPCCFSKLHFGCFGLFWEQIDLNYFCRRKYNYLHKCHWLIYRIALSLNTASALSPTHTAQFWQRASIIVFASFTWRTTRAANQRGRNATISRVRKGVECHLLNIYLKNQNPNLLEIWNFYFSKL